MKRILLSVLAVSVLGLSLSLFGPDTRAMVVHAAASNAILAQQSQAVTIQNFAFSPSSLTVAPGATVTWTNKDSTAHTVTADSGSGPNSGQIAPGQSYSFTFPQSGTFAYHCSIHPQMKATVIVSSPSGSNQPSSGTPQSQSTGNAGGTSTQPQSAAGPVAAGEGSVAANRYQMPLVIGTLTLAAGAILLLARRLFPMHR